MIEDCSMILKASTKTNWLRSAKRPAISPPRADLSLLTTASVQSGTGNYYRCSISLFLHTQTQVHHRRYARPRAVHPQHGDRRFHGGSGDHPGDARLALAAIPPARFYRDASRIPQIVVAINKMDLVDFTKRCSPPIRENLHGSRRLWTFTISSSYRSALSMATTSCIKWPYPLVSWPALLDHLETVPLARTVGADFRSRPVRDPPQPRFSRFCRADCRGRIRRGDRVKVLHPAD